ncbi:MAG: HAD-IA family hydrolase [Planctomycetes bacterium]|nr:HAD-IA family hydrolase [Planctomycetota bacterium]
MTPAATPIAAVLFDAVGTLLHARPTVAEAYHVAGARHGSRYGLADLKYRFRAALAAEEARDAERNQRTDEALERQRWQRIVAAVFDDVPDTSPVFEQLWDHFALADSWQLDAAAETILTHVGALRLPVGMASNFDARLRGICERLPALRSVDRLFISSEIGWRKPGADFFAAVASRLELPPEQLLLVGDDLTNDYLAARAAGWQAIWLSPQPHDHVPELDRATSLAHAAPIITQRAPTLLPRGEGGRRPDEGQV